MKDKNVYFFCSSNYSEKVKLNQSFLEDLSASETEVYNEEEVQEETHVQYQIQENHETKHEVRL